MAMSSATGNAQANAREEFRKKLEVFAKQQLVEGGGSQMFVGKSKSSLITKQYFGGNAIFLHSLLSRLG